MKKLFVLIALSIYHITYAVLPYKVLLCGVCRNVAPKICYSMRIMENIGTLFSDYRIIVYENNSRDTTKDILIRWQQNNPKVLVLSETINEREYFVNWLDSNEPFRPEAIARARNIVLNRALSAEYDEFEYVIWMDMDFKFEPSYEGFIDVFTTTKEWDAVFAYGVAPNNEFWDWYALRDQACPIGSELLGNEWWFLPKRLTLAHDDEWYPVYSAFGGCGIYKKNALRGCSYSGLVTEDLATFYRTLIDQKETAHPIIKKYIDDSACVEDIITIPCASRGLPLIRDPQIGIKTDGSLVWKMSSFVYQYPSVCEHVPLHASMIVHGYNKLFINPRLVFRYGG
jgi:hypothetical protein